MEEYIKKKIEEYDGIYIPIEDEKSLLNIYNFYKDGVTKNIEKEEEKEEKEEEKGPSGIECLYYAFLYRKKENRYLDIKYLTMAIEKGCSIALKDLIDIYIKKEVDLYHEEFILLKKYYKIEIKKGDVEAMRSLGYYYQHSKDYLKMRKYYQMAIEKGDSIAMKHLGYYYEHIEKNYVKMKIYYEMSIEKGNAEAMNNLGYYYEHTEKNEILMEKYYKMSIEKGSAIAMNNLGHHYENMNNNELAKKYYMMAVENKGETNLFVKYCKKHKDISFLELYDFLQINSSLISIFNENIFLPKKYYPHFIKLNIIFDDSIPQCVKNKQFILQETGIWPIRYKDTYMIQFMALLTIRRSSLPKDIIYLIAGYLFV